MTQRTGNPEQCDCVVSDWGRVGYRYSNDCRATWNERYWIELQVHSGRSVEYGEVNGLVELSNR